MTKSILLVGVGGQGTITAAKLLTTGLLEAGCDVKMSEIHGMSQRGGTVSSHVRYNADGKVYSPVIGEEGADILVSFEQMEALRWIDYVKPEGAIVTSTDKIDCQSVLTGRIFLLYFLPVLLLFSSQNFGKCWSSWDRRSLWLLFSLWMPAKRYRKGLQIKQSMSL